MSLIQILGIGKCQPIYTAHTLPNLFTRQTQLTSALQQYVDSYSLSDIDEHWLLLRDRYAGHDWAKAGLLKRFEDDANSLGGRISTVQDLLAVGSFKKLGQVNVWKQSSLDKFRNDEIERDWPEVTKSRSTIYNEISVDAGYFEVSVQFKFLYIAGALKENKLKHLVSGLGVRSGR